MQATTRHERAGGPVLADLRPGQRARVRGFTPDLAGPVRDRLVDLGFAEGVDVTLLRRAPLRDPSVFELLGYELCLRATQTRAILCDPLPAP